VLSNFSRYESTIEPSVLDDFSNLKEQLISEGAQVKSVSIEGLEHILSVYYFQACSEASSNLLRFDGIRYGYVSEKSEDLFDLYCKTRSEGFGQEVKRRIMLGTFALSSGHYELYYKKSQNIRRLLCKRFKEVFEEVDYLYLPTAPTRAFRLGEHLQDPIAMYLNDIFTIPFNIVGVPVISVPYPELRQGLPTGFQLVAPWQKDRALIELTKYLERRSIVGVPQIS
jgi:aspartyl-tRNA(Asn)/glutamyl-tRNA(Gln) amidotransferase subunit A